MRKRTDLRFQQKTHRKIFGTQIRQCRRPQLLTPESLKMTLAQVVSFYWGVGWCSILLEGESLISEVFLHLFKCLNKNIVNVAMCVDLNPMFHENQRRLPRFGDCSPHHEGTRLFLVKICSHRVINVCWRFCVSSVVLIVNSCFNCEEFSSEKKRSLALLYLPSVIQEEALLF